MDISQLEIATGVSGGRVPNSDATGTVTLFAANLGRRGFWAHNNSPDTWYIKMGDAASTVNYNVPIWSGSFYELPRPFHTGTITAVAASGTVGGALHVTEIQGSC